EILQSLLEQLVIAIRHFAAARGWCVVGDSGCLAFVGGGAARRPGFRRRCGEKGSVIENPFQTVTFHPESLTRPGHMKLFLGVESRHLLTDDRVIDAKDALVQPSSLAIESESAGAHQYCRGCPPF